jgi:hypothetical protein
MRVFCAAGTFALLVGLTVGCSGGPATGEVSGTVTYDGKAVPFGSIAFYPADGKGPSTGGTITDGKYSVSKVPVGTMKVRISGAKDMKEQKMSYDEKAPPVFTSSELLPPKYSDDKATELKYDVQAGVQTKNFDLTK